MREIKFRGLDINGKWHYGLLSISSGKTGMPEKGYYISNLWGMPWALQVIPRTVEQYTGLQDKNAKEIYGGDLIERYIIAYQEQRSFAEYVDFREWSVIKTVSEVIYENGSFVLRPIEKYNYYDSDYGDACMLGNECLYDCVPEDIADSEVKEAIEYGDGIIKYREYVLYQTDLEKLKIFKVIGNIY